MVKVEIRCPSCNKRGYIELEEEIINQSSRGVTAINVAKDQICSHSFVAYVDKNLDVRDCFLTDFQIELPTMETSARIEDRDIPERDTVDVDLIKINLHALQLSSILRGIFFKKPVVVIYKGDFLFSHVERFFEFIFKNSFDFDLTIMTPEQYKDSKKSYKKHLVLDGNKIVLDKEKILDPKKIKVERTLIQKFLAEYTPKSSLIILKNEIQKAWELTKDIMNLIKNYSGDEKLGKKKLIDNLAEQKNIKITFSYLEFLLDIIKNYSNFDLSVLSDYYFPAFGI